MANPGLVKGYKVASTATAANFKFGRCVKATANIQECTSVAATTDQVLGVIADDTLDAAKISTGKATIAVILDGIAYCETAGAIAIGAKVTVAADGRITTIGALTTGVNYNPVGIAESASAGAGEFINVYLTRGESIQGP